MEHNSFFKWVIRLNSILFLILILMGIGLIGFLYLESNDWNSRRAVEIKDESENIIKMRLGNITRICGHDIQYVELSSASTSKGFSSGGYANQTRNVVYFVGTELSPHWLYDTNDYLIENIAQLKAKGYECEDKATIAVIYEVIKDDSNKDGKLSKDDLVTVSLTMPDGYQYTELGSFDSVIDYETDIEGKYLTLLSQMGNEILVQKYLLTDFKKVSEKILTRIGKKT